MDIPAKISDLKNRAIAINIISGGKLFLANSMKKYISYMENRAQEYLLALNEISYNPDCDFDILLAKYLFLHEIFKDSYRTAYLTVIAAEAEGAMTEIFP